MREEQKSSTCPRCGRTYDPRKSRAYHRSEDPAELARLVGEMNARLEKGYQRYEADRRAAEPRRREVTGDLETVVSRVSLAKGRQRQLDEAVRSLSSREGGTFSSVELLDVLEAVGWPRHAAEEALGRLLGEPDRPYVVVLGGAKVSGKLAVIKSLLPRVDTMLVGGGMAYTILAAQGHEIGGSLFEEDMVGEVRAVLESAGVQDILTKILGTKNPHNVLRATFQGLESLRDAKEVGRFRGKSAEEVSQETAS